MEEIVKVISWRSATPGLVITGAVVALRGRKAASCAVCGAALAPGERVFRPAVSRHDRERFCPACVERGGLAERREKEAVS